MGVSDNTVKDWLGNKVRFADLFNGIIYGGEQIIRPEDLERKNNESSMIVEGKEHKRKSVDRRRDVIMNWKDSCSLVVLAVESQEKISYAMPIRNMLYDALAYTDQMKELWNSIPESEKPKKFSDEFFSRFRKEDIIYPVITIVLYYGNSGEWDGCTSIYDMFGNGIASEQKDVLKKYVSDYKVNLIELDNIENLNVFKSDLRETIGMLQCRHSERDLEKYVSENAGALSRLDLEACRVLRDVMEIDGLEKYMRKDDGREVASVCKAIEDLKKNSEMRGIREGKLEGIRILIATSREYGIDEDTIKIKLAQKYMLSEDEISKYMSECEIEV